MAERSSLADLADDLRALPARRRRAVMSALTAEERARLDLLLAPPPAADPVPEAPALSPWLRERIDEAVTKSGPGRWAITPATRQLLIEASAEVGSGASPGANPSLLGTLGGFLKRERRR